MQTGQDDLTPLVGHDALTGGFSAGFVDRCDAVSGGDGVAEKDGL